jgi:hypothetical protein
VVIVAKYCLEKAQKTQEVQKDKKLNTVKILKNNKRIQKDQIPYIISLEG